MTNSLFGIFMVLGLGGALAAFIVGIILAAQRYWKGAIVSLFLLVCSLLLFGGMLAWWITKTVHTASAMVTAREITSAAAQARREAAQQQIKALTPTMGTRPLDDPYWTQDKIGPHERLPIRYPYEIDADAAMDSGRLFRFAPSRIGSGPLAPSALDLRPMDIIDIADFAVDANLLVFRAEDGLKNESWGLFIFDTQEKALFPSEAAMWKQAATRGWSRKQELKSLDDHYSAYWDGM